MNKAPHDFLVDRYVGEAEAPQDIARYYFRVNMGLNLYITQELELDNNYLEATLDGGIRTLARLMVKRGNEILGERG